MPVAGQQFFFKCLGISSVVRLTIRRLLALNLMPKNSSCHQVSANEIGYVWEDVFHPRGGSMVASFGS
tara:strand:- start:435 stop:638 length:204 start_codon:yes stop_codon:yes gene_type:complete